MDIILKYFPNLSEQQTERFKMLKPLYEKWNARINVISRKDIGHLYERHVLHSLSIAWVISFNPGTKILDVGSGGGFPGVPLAIFFPQCQFHLIDSIGKKVRVIDEIVSELQLKNVSTQQIRAEELAGQWDFIVSRAVTALPVFTRWVVRLISSKQENPIPNGILYLKGGNVDEELRSTEMKHSVYVLDEFFEEDFFRTKALIHLFR